MKTRRMKLASVADVTLISVLVLAVGLMLLAPGAATPATNYTVQPILKVGEKAGDVLIPPDFGLSVEALNDNGQILIMTLGPEAVPRWLFQYQAGQFTPIVVSERAAPEGKWPEDVIVRRPLPMNQKGNAAFTASILRDTDRGRLSWGTFFWDAAAQQVKVVALKGMRAGSGPVFRQGGSAAGTGAYINNHDEVAFTADVSAPYFNEDSGLFFRTADGQLRPIIVPGGKLSDTTRLQAAAFPKLNDAGMIAFWAQEYPANRPGQFAATVYLWENGTFSLIAREGQDAPGGGKLAIVNLHSLSNTDRSVLIQAETRNPRRNVHFRFLDGQLTPLLEEGMELPGVGKLTEFRVTGPDDAGRYTFAALLEDGSTGLYQLAPGGTATLLLKSGTKTEWGTITRLGVGLQGRGQGVAVNSKGQIATVASFDDGPDTVVLLTPPAP
jgi:hypothetical protein